MKRTQTFCICLAILLLAISAIANDDTAKKYFLMQEGKIYTYKQLQPNFMGPMTSRMFYHKTKNGKEWFELINERYIGGEKIITGGGYFLKENIALKMIQYDIFGKRELKPKPLILKVPRKGEITHWSRKEEGDPGVIISYKAELIEKHKTPIRGYMDVLRLEEHMDVTYEPSLSNTTTYYYARGVGLVQTNVFAEGKLQKTLSMYLSRRK